MLCRSHPPLDLLTTNEHDPHKDGPEGYKKGEERRGVGSGWTRVRRKREEKKKKKKKKKRWFSIDGVFNIRKGRGE